MRPILFAAWAGTFCAWVAGAQPAMRKEPAIYAGNEHTSRVEVLPPGIRLGLRKAREFALAPLSGSERAALTVPGPRLRAGVHRSLPSKALSTGAWETAGDGSRVWRMAIHSPGSQAIRVEFRNFHVGYGRVWVHDGSNSQGPYTGRGLFDDGNFWTASVFSDSITIEYAPEPGAPESDQLPFEIRSISHQARSAAQDAPQATKSDPADYCHLDPNCFPEWKPAMSMVAQIAFEEDGVKYLCSGSLVATRDNSFKPYLLTAGHCIHSEAAARSLEVYWTYQTSSCGGTPPASRDTSAKSTVGAHLIDFAPIEDGDYSLVLLQDVPKGVVFSGWDAGDPSQGSNLTGLHHPAGSWKRISFGERIPDESVGVEDSFAPGDKYLSILWDKGRTEPGSSGSPLFSSPGVIVGTLTYGPYSPTETACEITPSIDGYGRFSNTYAHVKDYLENLPAASIVPDKPSVSFTVSNHVPPAGQVVRLTTQTSGQVTYKLRADAPWIKLSATNGTLSANSPAPLTISIDASQFDRPDQYSSTVTVFTGAAAPQYINVAVTVSADQSNVIASISPDPVFLSGGLWSFTVRLSETAGVATRLTGFSVNGADYSDNIQGFFGTDSMTAKGSLQAALQASGLLPGGLQYFEFRGIDEATGQHWYRVATVDFR